MVVEIFSRETVKPSCPTPNHLRNHKLSIIDQLAIQCYVPILLFYSPPKFQDSSQTNISIHLKKSLSETLTHFYPLAGKVINNSWIDCNDQGANFTEANVSGDISLILNKPDIDLLQLLLPYKLNENFLDKETVLVQVNYFSSGHIVISICVKHLIADASAVGNFVDIWGSIARFANNGSVFNVNGVIIDRTCLFPPIDMPEGLSWSESFLPEFVTKRFLFDGSKVAALRERIGNGKCIDRPTRFEAVSALIWGASITAAREDETVSNHVAMTVVNLRKKLNPHLPEQCIGNICQVAIAECSTKKSTDYSELAGKIRESIRMLDDEYVKKFHGDGKWLDFVTRLGGEYGNNSKVKKLNFSSWCRFPFYEVDFGWGKPIWVSTAMRQDNSVIFLDASDGQGIEAWVGLSKEDMSKLEQNPDILEFASFN